MRFSDWFLGIGALVVIMLVSETSAEVHFRPLSGKLTPINTGSGDIQGFSFEPVSGGATEALPANLYDNIDVGAGGTGTGGAGMAGAPAFFDWVAPGAAWGDDVHGLAGVINTLYYEYVNTGIAADTHTVFVAGNPSGPGTAEPTLTTIGLTPLATIAGISAPAGTFVVSITGLAIPYSGNAWVHLLDSGTATTFWATTQSAGLGFSHDLGGYSLSPATTYPISGPAIMLPGPFNVGIGLNQVPEPAAIALLGMVGIAILGWRRS